MHEARRPSVCRTLTLLCVIRVVLSWPLQVSTGLGRQGGWWRHPVPGLGPDMYRGPPSKPL